MPKKKSKLKTIAALTEADLEDWAGPRIGGRGRRYEQEGRVTDLAVTADEALIAWVDGSQRFATKVYLDSAEEPESICSCPYEIDCKHGVAVVLAYLKQVENRQTVSTARQDDKRLLQLADLDDAWDDDLDDEEEDEEEDEDTLPESMRQEIAGFLKYKTKTQLIDLILEFAGQNPEMARELTDRMLLNAGNFKSIINRLRTEIQELGHAPGWQDYWHNEGFTPDYSGVRKKVISRNGIGIPGQA